MLHPRNRHEAGSTEPELFVKVSEMPAIGNNQCIVGEGSVSMSVIGNVRHAGPAIAFHSKRHIAGKDVFESQRVHKPRIYIDCISRPTEAIALAKGIPYRHTLDAASNAGEQTSHFGDRMGDASAVQILVGDRHYFFTLGCPERSHSIRVSRVEQIGAGKIKRAVKKCSLSGLRLQGKTPSPITGLNGLVSRNQLARAAKNAVIHGVVLAGWHLQAET